MANINRYDDLSTGAIAYATFISCIVLVVTILGIRALTCAWVEGEEVRKLENARYTASDQLISEQKAKLAGYQKEMVEVAIPAEPGQDGAAQLETRMEERIHIPIERARELIMHELSSSEGSDPAEPSA